MAWRRVSSSCRSVSAFHRWGSISGESHRLGHGQGAGGNCQTASFFETHQCNLVVFRRDDDSGETWERGILTADGGSLLSSFLRWYLLRQGAANHFSTVWVCFQVSCIGLQHAPSCWHWCNSSATRRSASCRINSAELKSCRIDWRWRWHPSQCCITEWESLSCQVWQAHCYRRSRGSKTPGKQDHGYIGIITIIISSSSSIVIFFIFHHKTSEEYSLLVLRSRFDSYQWACSASQWIKGRDCKHVFPFNCCTILRTSRQDSCVNLSCWPVVFQLFRFRIGAASSQGAPQLVWGSCCRLLATFEDIQNCKCTTWSNSSHKPSEAASGGSRSICMWWSPRFFHFWWSFGFRKASCASTSCRL